MKLRDYQQDCLVAIKKTFRRQKKQLIVLPTGAGKTVIFTEYLRDRAKPALVICPTIDLVEQTIRVMRKLGPSWYVTGVNDGIYASRADVMVITAAALRFKSCTDQIRKNCYNDIIIDEAHKAACPTYEKFLASYDFPHRLLGCTATPDRLDGQDLHDMFQSTSYSIGLVDLIERGFLCDLKGFRVKTNDNLTKKDIRYGDFTPLALRRLDNDSRNRLILDVYRNHCTKKKTLIFCVNIEHAKHCCFILREHGFKAAYLHGEMTKGDRKEVLRLFKEGQIDVLTNCQLLTEGFDEPSIEALIMARPTASRSLYVQMIGRGARKHEGKTHCEVYDFTSHCHSLVNFQIACGGREPGDWKGGISFRERTRELETLSKEVRTSVEESPLYQKSKLFPDLPYEHQWRMFPVSDIPKEYMQWLTGEEASFLIWYERLKERYGNDFTNRRGEVEVRREKAWDKLECDLQLERRCASVVKMERRPD